MILLTTQTGFLKPIAWLLGQIFNGLFNLIYSIASWFTKSPHHVPIIAICVVLFTIVVRLILLPLTVKQQKYSKFSSIMAPELREIQEKYKDKRDQVSMMQMQAETKEVYAKYGTSASGGCLTMLIQLPIMFALYRVIYKIPGYVAKIKYLCAATAVATTSLTGWNTDAAFTESGKEKSGIFYDFEVDENTKELSENTINKVIDEIYNLSNSDWNLVKEQEITIDEDGKIALVLKIVETEENTKENTKDNTEVKATKTYKMENLIIANDNNKKSSEWKIIGLSNNVDYYIFDAENNVYKVSDKASLEAEEDKYKNVETVATIEEKIHGYNNLFGINLTEAPGWKLSWALLIPLLAGLTQWLSAKLMENKQKTIGPANEQQASMEGTMKVMNLVMPIMSAVFCVSFASCIGLYWIASSVVQIVVQVVINKKMNSMPIEEMIAINIEKANIKREKQGKKPLKVSNVTSNYVEQVKKAEAREARKEAREEEIRKSTTYYNSGAKPGSLAEKANMVKMYNERNNNGKKDNK